MREKRERERKREKREKERERKREREKEREKRVLTLGKGSTGLTPLECSVTDSGLGALGLGLCAHQKYIRQYV